MRPNMSRCWKVCRSGLRASVASACVTVFVLACVGGPAVPALGKDGDATPEETSPIPRLRSDLKERIEALEEKVWAFRREGDFRKAHAVATKLWEIRSGAQGSAWWQTVECAHMVDLLDQIARMPADGQRRLAESYARDERARQLLKERHYAEAIAALQLSLDVRRSLLGVDHWQIGHTLNFLGHVQRRASKLADAEMSFRSAIELYRQDFCAGHPILAESLLNLASVLHDRKTGRHEVLEEALTYCEEALSIYQRAFGNNHKIVANSLKVMGGCLKDAGQFELAEKRLREALAILRSAADGDDQAFVGILSILAETVEALGRQEEAIALLREELELRKSKIGDDELGIARLQHQLAVLHDRRAEYDAAQPMYEASLDTFNRALPPDDIVIGISQMSFGFFLHRVGMFADAEEHLRAAVPILHARHGTYHWRPAMVLSRLAISVTKKGDFAEAERLFLEARQVYRRIADEQDSWRVDNLGHLANLYMRTGDYAAAETLARQVLAATRNEFGESHYRFANASALLGSLLLRKGQFREAEQMLEQAIATSRRAYGYEDHAEIAAASRSLAEVLAKRGDTKRAETAARKAVRIFEATHDERHSDHVAFWNTLATILITRNKAAEAEVISRRALQFARDVYGPDNPSVAGALLTLGEALEAGSKSAEAENAYREALTMFRKFMGDRHTDTARTLHHLAGLLARRREFDSALPLYHEAFTITEQKRSHIAGDERARAAFSEALDLKLQSNELANLMIRLGDMEGALTILERGRGRALLDLLIRSDRDLAALLRKQGDVQRAHELQQGLEKEREALFAMRIAEARLRVAHKSADAPQSTNDPEYAKRVEAAVTARKAYGHAEATVFGLLRGAWPDARPLAPEKVREALRTGDLMLVFSETDDAVTLLLVPPVGDGKMEGAFVAKNRSDVGRLHELAESASRELVREPTGGVREGVDPTARYELFLRIFPEPLRDRILQCRRLVVVPDGVIRQIPLESLVVAPATTGTARPSLLLDAGPAIVYADSASVYANRCQVGRSRQLANRDVPVSALIVGDPDFRQSGRGLDYPHRGVVVSSVEPDGNAGQAGLRRGDVLMTYGGTAIADTNELLVAMEYVGVKSDSVERDPIPVVLVEYWRNGSVRKAPVEPGELGLKFAAGSPAAALDLQRMSSRSIGEGAAEVSALDQIRLYGGTLTPLDGARLEAKAVGQLFRAAGGHVDMLVGRDATIANIESRVSNKRYVHMATHGIVGSKAHPYDASLALTQPALPTPDDIGFLTLDHLVRAWRGKLSDCELVVLSACETTKGVETGDSSIALPWGFMYAGAPTVVASLWKVDDTATTLLMTRFYENLLGQFTESRNGYAAGTHMPKAEALRESKSWLRSLPPRIALTLVQRGGLASESIKMLPGDAIYDFSHPYYWAAFVLIGAPE